MISLSSSGSYSNTMSFLNKFKLGQYYSDLNRYGRMGVSALARYTPRDSGATASSWDYYIQEGKGRVTIVWYNTNNPGGIPVAILIQYGHGTKNGGYVQGIDYINPAIRPIFDQLATEIWGKVRNG